MRAEVAGVKQSPALDLDQQHMRVKGAVIGQIWRNLKRPYLKLLPTLPGSEVSIDRFAENPEVS